MGGDIMAEIVTSVEATRVIGMAQRDFLPDTLLGSAAGYVKCKRRIGDCERALEDPNATDWQRAEVLHCLSLYLRWQARNVRAQLRRNADAR